jgi:hypothetical protein
MPTTVELYLATSSCPTPSWVDKLVSHEGLFEEGTDQGDEYEIVFIFAIYLVSKNLD